MPDSTSVPSKVKDEAGELDLTGRIHHRIPEASPGAPYEVVFVDRDGTLNALAPGYRTPGDFNLLPGAMSTLAGLAGTGCRIVLVTNQRGLATGLLTWEELRAVHGELLCAVRAAGGDIDDVRLCPHDEGECECRKPLPGLLEAFFDDNPHVRRERCLMIGDSVADEGAATSAGVRFVRVEPTRGLVAAADSLPQVEKGTMPVVRETDHTLALQVLPSRKSQSPRKVPSCEKPL